MFSKLINLRVKKLWAEINRLNKHAEFLQAEKDIAYEKITNFEKIKNLPENSIIYPLVSQIGLEQLVDHFNMDYFRDYRIHPFIREAFSLIADRERIIDKTAELDKYLNLEDLNSVFKKYGSDKSERHNYGSVYQTLIGNNKRPIVLEIGIGSENNFMYASGTSGGSLKAWREFYSEGVIIGADIDEHAVRSVEAPAMTVDQTNDFALSELVKFVNKIGELNLVVEDGFHDLHANIRTLQHLLPCVKSGGFYVIEDVHESMIDIWTVIGSRMKLDLKVMDLRAYRPGVSDNILVVIQKN
jgi:cephalosporin hydroxylase